MSGCRIKSLETCSLQNITEKRKDLVLCSLSFKMVEGLESCRQF